jgi:glycosyltransferase involved in cell wall biosynthesis
MGLSGRLAKIADKDVIFAGRVSEKDKILLLQKAKILLSCSSSEGFNMTIPEALACGACPVVSDLPVHREVMENHGFVFTSESEAVKIILHLLDNEEERRSIVRRGRKFVEERYTWEKVTDAFLKGLTKLHE